MAVAVKNSPEATTASHFDRMPVISLVGVVYVVASLTIVFKLIPSLWAEMCSRLGLEAASFGSMTLQALVMLGAATALLVLGARLLGPKAAPGVKAGIFVALLSLLLILLVTRWFSLWVEYFIYKDLLFGSSGPTVGAIITGVVGGGLLLLVVRWFLRPTTEKSMVGFENQGWFTAAAYKKGQGQKVRRGTILGLLLLVGSGIYTMVTHNTLARGPEDWAINIPFTGTVTITAATVGDAELLPDWKEKFPTWGKDDGPRSVTLDRYTLRDLNAQLDPKSYRKIYDDRAKPDGPWKFKNGDIVPLKEYEEEAKKKYYPSPLEAKDPAPAWGNESWATIPLLPGLKFSLPLLLLGLSLWVAWRIVNQPTFADFLIATEAELNKVSWTTRKKLYQDTIVVLVTVFLMAVYLFAMDQIWARLLSWRPIGVIVISKDAADATKGTDTKPW